MPWRKVSLFVYIYKFRSTVKSQTKLATREKKKSDNLISQGWLPFTGLGDVGQGTEGRTHKAPMKSQLPRKRIQTAGVKIITRSMRLLLFLSLSMKKSPIVGRVLIIAIWIRQEASAPRNVSFVATHCQEKALLFGKAAMCPCALQVDPAITHVDARLLLE